MANIEPFEEHAERYEQWFERHEAVYRSELNAVAHFVKPGDRGLEVGVGTGRFAVPLGITDGVEPSQRMAQIARDKGIQVPPPPPPSASAPPSPSPPGRNSPSTTTRSTSC